MALGTESSAPVDLRAVILVARLNPGPRLIFHYPPKPQRPSPRRTESGDDSASTSGSEERNKSGVLNSTDDLSTSGGPLHSDSLLSASGFEGKAAACHHLFGYSEETLQKLLSPGCWSDRKKFEICLNGLTFVGHPIWAAQDGSWTRRHSHDDETLKQQSTPPKRAQPGQQSNMGSDNQELRPMKPDHSQPVSDFTHAPESLDSRTAVQSFATSMASESSLNGTAAAEKLSMFNVVFVLGSSKSNDRRKQVVEAHQHIIKILSKAIHYCQRQNQYLGLQSKKLLHAKTKARQDGLSEVAILEKMIESSELGWCLKEVFEKIRAGEIAGIRMNGMEMALQIPSTTTSDPAQDRQLEPHSGLLLLESKETLLRELNHPDASTLAFFIREHTPTKSLQKLATRLGIALDEVFHLARHLIKWRKARLIDPLHPRNTYIVCNEALVGELQNHYAEDYAKKFPVLPSLTQMLQFLSGKPVRYGMLIPSRDHRNPYMQILAYLVQHRIVEQLKTYGWLQAPTTPVSRARNEEAMNENRRPLSVASLLSPQMRPVKDEDSMSVSSERTAIPVSVLENRPRRLQFTPFSHANLTHGYGDGDEEVPQIVKDPLAASTEDEQRLEHIRATLEDDDLRDRFPSLLRYFDGTYAFEDVAASEGVKRAKVEAWLDALQKDGFLMTFRAT